MGPSSKPPAGNRRPRWGTVLWGALAALNTAWLLWMTLRPNPQVAVDLAPLTAPATARGISYFWLIDIAGNLAVFVPLGAALTLALGPRRRAGLMATALGAALSLTIELLQATRATRVPAGEDWILNTLGTALGALLAWGFCYLSAIYFKKIRGAS